MIAQLTIVAGLHKQVVQTCLATIRTYLTQLGVPRNDFSLYGRKVNLEQASEAIGLDGRSAFLLAGHDLEFHKSSIKHFSIDTFTVKGNCETLNAEWWVLEFAKASPVRQAWVVNAEYDYWQNAEDPLQYVAQKKPYEHLQMRSNGLPPPVEQLVIDTSRNPGRRILRVGYVEAVGSPMWFGPEFWTVVSADKKSVMLEARLYPKQIEHDLLRIQPVPHPFSLPDGNSLQAQVDLRNLLYSESKCNNQ